MMLRACLADLENRVDPDVEEQLLAEWLDFTEGRFAGVVFSPKRGAATPPQIEWPKVSVNAALDDYDKMALQQLRVCSDNLAAGDGAIMSVRCNYGSSILPSLFGVELFIMDEALDTLPTSYPLRDTAKIEAVVARGAPDLTAGLGGKVLEMGHRFTTLLAEYPKVGRYVHLYHPDLQGPMDVVEVLWGSEFLTQLYENPGLVKSLLELVTETYIAFMRAWGQIAPFSNERCVHWSMMHKGHVMLRDDSAMNLSPALFDEFIRPYNQRILDAFGGGGDHFCGKGDHFIANLSELEGLHAVAMSQPEYNDMETIFRHTVDKGIKLLALERAAADAAIAAGRDLHGHVHCSQ